MKQEEIKKIAKDVVKIINDSKATFFVQDENIEIPPEEVLSELSATICTDVEMYFYEKIKNLNK